MTDDDENSATVTKRPSIALVVVDLDVPHLDHPFEYAVPEPIAALVQIGSVVQVPFGRRRLTGWIVGFAQTSSLGRKLSPIGKLLCQVPLLTAGVIGTAKYLARKNAVNLAHLLGYATPARRVGVEKKMATAGQIEIPPVGDAESHRPARIVSSLFPGQMLDGIGHAVESMRADSSGQVVVVVPTAAQVRLVAEWLRRRDDSLKIVEISIDQSPNSRYRAHLLGRCGHANVVVGTRSAVWASQPDLKGIVIWDSGDDRLKEPRSPRLDALDIAVARSHTEGVSVTSIGYARSLKDQLLIDSGWATDGSPERRRYEELIPKISVFDDKDAEREGVTGRTRLPDSAFRLIRSGLADGSVLLQVAAAGYETPVEAASTEGEETVVERTRIGSDRIAEEVARAFPSVTVTVSSSTAGVVAQAPGDLSQIVIATAGAEPRIEGGYAAVVVTETEGLAYLPELGAMPEAARRWMNAFALARPGSRCLLVGSLPSALEQTMVRWAPKIIAEHVLNERRELGLPPVRWMVSIQSSHSVIESLRSSVTDALASFPDRWRILDVPVHPADPGSTSNQDHRRLLITCESRLTMRLMDVIRKVQVGLSAAAQPLLLVETNPDDLI